MSTSIIWGRKWKNLNILKQICIKFNDSCYDYPFFYNIKIILFYVFYPAYYMVFIVRIERRYFPLGTWHDFPSHLGRTTLNCAQMSLTPSLEKGILSFCTFDIQYLHVIRREIHFFWITECSENFLDRYIRTFILMGKKVSEIPCSVVNVGPTHPPSHISDSAGLLYTFFRDPELIFSRCVFELPWRIQLDD